MLSLVAALFLTACDLEEATSAQLATLTSPAQRSAYRFELSVQAGALQLRLVSGSGLVRSREVAATGVCEDDAMVAAVILSAWMAQSEPPRSPRALTKPAPRPGPVRPPIVEPTPSAPAAPAVEPAPALAAEQVEDPDLVTEPAVKARWAWSAAVEGGAVIGGGGALALTVRAEGGMRVGVVADLTVSMEREQDLGSGSVLWAREFGSLGVRVRWLPAKRWLIDASLSVAAGWVFARGVGFSVSRSGQVDGGACGGVVVGGYALGPFGTFLSARVCGWPWAPRLAVEGTEQQLQLPVLDAVMGVGVMWGGGGGG